MTRYERLQQQIQRLTLAEKQALQAWLNADIEQAQQPPDIQPVANREVVETTRVGRLTFQSELVKCGKANCGCATQGSLHGPYWYGYCRDKGRLKSWYIGKELNLSEVAEADEAPSTSGLRSQSQ